MEEELITVHFVWTAAAAVLSWTPDQDYFVRYIQSSAICAVGYTNTAFASLITPSQVRRDLLYLANQAASNASSPSVVINRTIYAKETLYVSQTAVVGSLTLFLQPMPVSA